MATTSIYDSRDERRENARIRQRVEVRGGGGGFGCFRRLQKRAGHRKRCHVRPGAAVTEGAKAGGCG
eukprot:6210829-Pleurochrysis_carterae.AAC.2